MLGDRKVNSFLKFLVLVLFLCFIAKFYFFLLKSWCNFYTLTTLDADLLKNEFNIHYSSSPIIRNRISMCLQLPGAEC
jgi:hypothetical protein